MLALEAALAERLPERGILDILTRTVTEGKHSQGWRLGHSAHIANSAKWPPVAEFLPTPPVTPPIPGIVRSLRCLVHRGPFGERIFWANGRGPTADLEV